jgi:hypothetical protein
MTNGYSTTLPELIEECAKSPYGGATGRPRELRGYLELPDGKCHYLGDIGIRLDGWSDGLLTDVELHIKAKKFEEEGGTS